MATFWIFPLFQVFDGNGDPVNGAKAYFYEPGTSTPKTVYSDVGLSVPHPSPLVADAYGILTPVYVDGADGVKIDITTADDVQLPGYPRDNVNGIPVGGLAASSVPFDASADIAADDVQEAIEAVHDDAAIKDEANTFTADQTIVSTDAGTAAGPLLKLYRDSASPAASDGLAAIEWRGNTSLDEEVIYARVVPVITDPTSGAEYAYLALQTMQNNAWATRFRIGAGLYADGQTDQGAGTVNAAEFYRAGALARLPFAGIIFNGTGTVAVISSFGMHASTPLTDNGTGQYTVTLDAAEPDTNYYPVFSGGQLAGTGDTFFGITAKSTTALTFTVFQAGSSATPTDRNLIHVLFFR